MESREEQKHLKLSSNPFKAGFQMWWRMMLFQFCLVVPLALLISILVNSLSQKSDTPSTPSTAPESSF